MTVFEEGDKKFPYQDRKGNWTIAIGFTSVNGVRVSQFTPPLSDYMKLKTFYDHTFKALSIAMRFASNFAELNSLRQEVLIGMAYQMGRRLLGFHKTKILIEKRNYIGAGIEMLDSDWFRIDSPNRAVRMSEYFKTGKE